MTDESQLHHEKQPQIENTGVQYTQGGLKSRNIRIHRRRTSVRLEPAMWGALNDIAFRESAGIHQLCTAIHDLKEEGASFTSALRNFIVEYYRSPGIFSAHILHVRNHLRGSRLSPESRTC